MRGIPFVKYTSCGNNFVILDQIDGEGLGEANLARFAHQATDGAFGIGCDNLLVVQRCAPHTLTTIARERDYWDHPPRDARADFVFRMFEPDGSEALCCGNGLICIADYLRLARGVETASILTEVPLTRPRVLSIGSQGDASGSWVNLGHPRRAPAELVTPGFTRPAGEVVEVVPKLTVRFRRHDLQPYSEATTLEFSGYLVFTGEPHLVIFPEESFSLPRLADTLFARIGEAGADHRVGFGTWLVERVGAYLNTYYRDRFPRGINVNFVRRHPDQRIRYRCFERGIDRETLACGTGALAVAYVSRWLEASGDTVVDVIPERCRWHDARARIRVRGDASGWVLSARPSLVYEGTFRPALPVATPRGSAASGLGGERQWLESLPALTAVRVLQ